MQHHNMTSFDSGDLLLRSWLLHFPSNFISEFLFSKLLFHAVCRCVAEEERAFALGMQFVILRLFGE